MTTAVQELLGSTESAISDDIVLQAIDKGLVGGNTFYTDSTHLKASANKHKLEKKKVEIDTSEYLNLIEKAVNEDRKKEGKKCTLYFQSV